MMKLRSDGNSNDGGENMRVLRIAHSSLTPELRQRERALARRYPDVQLELVTTERWREAEIEVDATPDDLFPVRTARSYLSKHIQLFAYDPRPITGMRSINTLIDSVTNISWLVPKVTLVVVSSKFPCDAGEPRTSFQLSATLALAESGVRQWTGLLTRNSLRVFAPRAFPSWRR